MSAPPPTKPADTPSERARQLEAEVSRRTAELEARAQAEKARLAANLAEFVAECHADPEPLEEITEVRNLSSELARAVAALPPIPPDDAPPTPRVQEVSDNVSGALVVVVDDDPTILAIVTQILTDEGYRVQRARDGVEALDVLLKRVLPRERPDLLILDLMMPFLGGDGVLAALDRTSLFDLPRLIISAGAVGGMPDSLRREFVFIKKPIDLEHMLSTIRSQILEGRRRRGASE